MSQDIGQKIKTLRTNVGLTQKDLAKLLGCTDIMISRYELGVSQISIPQLQKIAKLLNTPISSFFDENSTGNTIKTHTFKKHFVFDLDDTLIDGRQFCGETMARVITQNYPHINFDLVVQIHESIRGLTVDDLYIQTLKKLNIHTDIQPLLQQDKLIMDANIENIHIFDGVVDILEFLKKNNKKLYLCTNRLKDLMEKILKANHIRPYFEEVISCIDAGYRKPNPYCLTKLIEESGDSKVEFIYFGDSEVDAQFATNANIDHIIFDQYLNNKNLFKKLVNMFLEKQINGF